LKEPVIKSKFRNEFQTVKLTIWLALAHKSIQTQSRMTFLKVKTIARLCAGSKKQAEKLRAFGNLISLILSH
jgi:hypothetical protein